MPYPIQVSLCGTNECKGALSIVSLHFIHRRRDKVHPTSIMRHGPTDINHAFTDAQSRCVGWAMAWQ